MTLLPALRIATAALFVASIALGVATERTSNGSRHWTSAASNGIMGYALSERTLQLDLLNARAGLLRNYDPVNADLASGRENLGDLEHLPMGPAARQILASLAATDRYQESLVERFKSDNALLQNSLARFRANGAIEPGAQNILSARILALTLDTSPQTVREARAALARLPSAAEGTSNAQFIAHARLLVTVLPEIDNHLRAIRAMRIESRIEKLQTVLRVESGRRATLVRKFESSLLVTMMLLALASVSLVLVQRWRTRELQSQAENARLSAAIATPLVDTGEARFATRVEDAVRRLALHIGAKQLQLAIPGIVDFAPFSWPGENPDAGWLSRLVEAAERDRAWKDGRIIVSRKAAREALFQAMLEAGLDDLVLLRAEQPFPVIIGFEPASLATAQRRDHLAALESAIVTIAHGARREALQLERDRLERMLARARRMETIGAMASGVAHNFNNIIGAIGGFAEIGQNHTRPRSLARNSFDEIRAAVLRARDLVDEILGFARRGRSLKRAIDLLDVLKHAVRLLAASTRNDEAFHLHAPDEAYPVLGASSDLQQVIINICNNAAFASDGRPVALSLSRERLRAEREFSHGKLGAGPYAVVAIADSGPGVSTIALPRLFEPFFTTKGGGTGLGLSTAWEVVQDHGGTIDVRSRPGGGTCFSVWIPEIKEPRAGAIIGDGSQILLLTDPDAVAEHEELLAELGYEPMGYALPADRQALGGAISACAAVLVSTSHSCMVEDAARAIGPALAGRPLLAATLERRTSDRSDSLIQLKYPVQAEQLAEVLASAIAPHALVRQSKPVAV